MRLRASLTRTLEIDRFVAALSGPAMRTAGARGLTEHAQEQRRLSVTVMTRMTGLPKGRVGAVTRTHAASAGGLVAKVVVSDRAIGLHEFGSPVWNADLKPKAYGKGVFRGPRSSSAGAEATGWNRRKVYRGSFIGKGRVLVRKGGKLKMLSGPVLANELVDRSKTNSKSVEAYMEQDLSNRVMRHIALSLGL